MKTILIIVGVGLLLVVVLYLVFGPGKKSTEQAQPTLPSSVQRLVPPSWSVIANQACDFDADTQDEWLVIYHYDGVSVQPAGQPSGTYVAVSPIGGAIYDARLEMPLQTGKSQYQVTTLTPYRLLPDFTVGKGQGYLGESAVRTLLFPPVGKDGKCQPTELGFLGYSNGNSSGATSLPTRLSIFYWAGDNLGYQGSSFTGNARVDADIPTKPDQFVTRVTTYNLLNDRSLLCQAMSYNRTGPKQQFQAVPNSATLDFCYGAPGDPTYPEGVVAAVLRNHAPSPAKPNAPMPPTNSFLLPGVSLPSGLAPPVNILAVTNTASAAPVDGGGHLCTVEYGDDGRGWWCGQFSAVVTSEAPIAGGVREIWWRMISVSLKDVVDEMHWRIASVEVR
jgi:hypothetical protein